MDVLFSLTRFPLSFIAESSCIAPWMNTGWQGSDAPEPKNSPIIDL
jgi:hypothetical protein